MVKNWAMKTPKKFKFTAKFPKVITHDKRLKEVDNELERFFDAMSPLKNKTLALLIEEEQREVGPAQQKQRTLSDFLN